MASHGSAFLDASLGGVLRRIWSERVAIETDPIRSRKAGKNVEKNVELLVQWCQELWKSIYDAREYCPDEMRGIFVHIRALIEARYLVHAGHHPDLPWQGVSAFLFLRFFVPAILNPHLFGFWPGMPDEPVQRTLTQIAKVIQSLANLNVAVHNQDYMRAVREFLISNCSTMVEYLDTVSATSQRGTTSDGPSPLSAAERHERRRLTHIVKHRSKFAPTLNREAIPTLPQMIDLPKHLAVVTSIVVRHTRRQLITRTGAASERMFDEFCQKCLEVEENALLRVSQLASHSRSRRDQPPTVMKFLELPPDSPSSPTQGSHRDRKVSLPTERRAKKKSHRPSTAPGNASPQPQLSPSDASLPATPVPQTAITRSKSQELRREMTKSLANASGPVEGSEPRSIRPSLGHHPRSTSTDSALLRRHNTISTTSTSAPVTYLTADILAANFEEDATRRKKGLLRGFLSPFTSS